MIVFNLDETLANVTHRLHYVDPLSEHPEYYREPCTTCQPGKIHKRHPQLHRVTKEPWKPNWKDFDSACLGDTPVEHAVTVLKSLIHDGHKIEIWTGRSDCARLRTIRWLSDKIWKGRHPAHVMEELHYLRMRPEEEVLSDHKMKEKWIRDLSSLSVKIEMAFESDDDMIRIWNKYGIPAIKITRSST